MRLVNVQQSDYQIRSSKNQQRKEKEDTHLMIMDKMKGYINRLSERGQNKFDFNCRCNISIYLTLFLEQCTIVLIFHIIKFDFNCCCNSLEQSTIVF
jgi:hypothetical protein